MKNSIDIGLNSNSPTVISSGIEDHDFIVFNLADYARLYDSEHEEISVLLQEEYKNEVFDYVSIRLRQIYSEPSEVDAHLDDVKDFLETILKNPDYIDDYFGGAASLLGFGVSFLDTDVLNVKSEVASSFLIDDYDVFSINEIVPGFEFTDNADKFCQLWSVYHEGAHSSFGLLEVGADFLAAAQLLNSYPESRDFLELKRDLRLLGPLFLEERLEHGYGATFVAIDAILKASAEEFSDIDAEFFDSQGLQDLDSSPEVQNFEIKMANVVSALHDQFEHVIESKDLPVLKQAVESMRISGGFPEGSNENDILDLIVQAIDRMTTPGGYTLNNTIEAIPKPAPDINPAL